MNFESTLEDHVEAYLVKRVKALGGMSLKADRIDGRRFIDRICILPSGVTLYVECKRPVRGRLFEHQKEILKRLNGLGHMAAKVKNTDEIDALLEELS